MKQLHDLLDELSVQVEYKIFLVDDASQDGTPEIIQSNFPNVTVLKGSGELFWSGGMRKGYDHIKKHDIDFDYLIAFNDDITIDRVGFRKFVTILLSRSQLKVPFILSGSFQNYRGETTYGGGSFLGFPKYRFNQNKITGEDGIQKADVVNMNFTAISHTTIARIKFLSYQYRHAKADFDYSLKANQAGINVYTTQFVLGFCERNCDAGTSRQKNISRRTRFRRLLSVKEEPVRERLLFCRTWGGPLWVFWFVRPYLKALLNA